VITYLLIYINVVMFLVSRKNIYVVQPYQVGNKDRKSLAIIIPAQIAKEYNFDTSTIFALKVDNMRRLTLQNVGVVADEEQPTAPVQGIDRDRPFQPVKETDLIL
jgi:antitoxin component of MazEF toxin-antitoxin module